MESQSLTACVKPIATAKMRTEFRVQLRMVIESLMRPLRRPSHRPLYYLHLADLGRRPDSPSFSLETVFRYLEVVSECCDSWVRQNSLLHCYSPPISSYFACKPNFGLFAAANKLMPAGSQVTARNSAGANNRQESLLSYCSNLSSVSRSYRAQYAPSVQAAPVRAWRDTFPLAAPNPGRARIVVISGNA
ncbi:hypothetical protein X801_03450 [Opisthorchis viverrini]|uniref:Uncharacterized protein n=1 Tax=Opisthorchis viverrini TaxID=6198 RepID=A0A1S8X1W3_OPIVI|nr:hypothetical protein X801_03450 [Opisthorchis viverrini]